MQMIGGVTSMVGMTIMLSSVRAEWAPGDGEAGLGLGRTVALHYRSSALYHIHEHIRCLYF